MGNIDLLIYLFEHRYGEGQMELCGHSGHLHFHLTDQPNFNSTKENLNIHINANLSVDHA